jgi:hypothetical protein
MNIPDPVVTGVTTATVLQAVKQGQDYIAAALGHPGESVGTILGNWTHRRIKNAETIGNKADLTLLNLNLLEPVAHIPFSTAFPILEAASLQEESSMQDRWANMLANAADPRATTPVLPIFSFFLRDMGPKEIGFLDALYRRARESLSNAVIIKHISQNQYNMEELQQLFFTLGFAKTDFHAASFSHHPYPNADEDKQAFFMMLDIIRRHDIIRQEVLSPKDSSMHSAPTEIVRRYHFSDLGAAFVRACLPPESK